MRVIVSGNRDWADNVSVQRELEALPRPLTVVHGGARGADAAAHTVARSEPGMTPEQHLADWDRDGKAAGPIRNEKMALIGAHLWLAFWDGKERGPKGNRSGTLDGIVRAVKHKIPVVIHPAGYSGSVVSLVQAKLAFEYDFLRRSLAHVLGACPGSLPSDAELIQMVEELAAKAADG